MVRQFRVPETRVVRWRKGVERTITRPECIVEVDIPDRVLGLLAGRAARNRTGRAVLGGIVAKVTSASPWQEVAQ
jgi:hypothetical protein